MGRFFLGVDGGGTNCRARLCAADGARLGQGNGGPANIRLGLDAAWAAISQAVEAAIAQSGLDRAMVLADAVAGLGLAGITNPADAGRAIAASPLPFAGITAATDAHTACLGAFAGADGAILIAGTGSAGYAIVDGIGTGIGGWGFEVSDDGSGAAIGRQAIRAALRGHDGLGPQTDFTRQVMARLGGSPDTVVAWVGTARPADYGSFAPLVLEQARAGDGVATAIVGEAADHLANHVRRLLELGAPAVCLMGGLGAAIRDWLPAATLAHLAAPQGDAMDGAILLARRA